jgi:propionate CoA-transferase
VSIAEGKIHIDQEGKEKKFIKQVEQKTFSGRFAAHNHKPVLFITERCVFNLTEKGMELIEIAPGIDLQKDILDQMGFRPVMNGTPKLMDARIFSIESMGLKNDLLTIPLEDRLIYNAQENVFFVNFENLYIRSREDIEKIRTMIDEILGPLRKKVNTIVNYGNFNILPDLIDDYTGLINYAMQYYEEVTRYTTSAFLRMKLGDELEKRHVAPYIYESPEEARQALKKTET